MEHKSPEELQEINSQIRDEADYAQALDLYNQELLHERAKKLNQAEYHADFDGVHCLDCDIKIPKKRLELKKIRCVDCQEDLENKKKRNR